MKRTLLFYINSVNHGGAERVMIQLAYRFALAGYRAILVTSFEDVNAYDVPDIVERITTGHVERHRNKVTKTIARVWALRKICKEERPDAVISFLGEPNMRAILATRGLKVKTIVSVRNDPEKEYAGVIGRLNRMCLMPMADGCVFQTKDAQNAFVKKLRDKSAVIFNSVSDVFFNTHYEGGKDIVTVGRLTKQKNQELLIRAYANMKDKYDGKVRIYGAGELERELHTLICNLGLQERVLLMGSTNDVPSILSRAGMFVLSSDYEGMPNCLMEAMAVGLPCISADCPCGGPRTLISSQEEGILFPVGDAETLTEAMERVISDPVLAGQLGRNAKKRAEHFREDTIFEMWKAYVEKVLNV